MVFVSEEDLKMIIQAIENEDYQDAIKYYGNVIDKPNINLEE